MDLKGKTPAFERRPTLTDDEPISGKRITFMISAHGTELLDYRIDKTGLIVRVFSLAGELGICTVRGNGSFSRDDYFEYVKNEMAKSSPEDSTYQVIKILQNAKREEYKEDVRRNFESVEEQIEDAQEDLIKLTTRLDKEGKRIIKDENDEWIENEEISEQKDFIRELESILQKIKQASTSTQKEEHIRTYEPVINKFYNFREEIEYEKGKEEGHLVSRFIKVVHYDGQAENSEYELLDLKESGRVEALFSDGLDQELLEKYKTQNAHTKISLDIIITIAKKLGFTIINIIDLSCRMTDGDDANIPSIKEEEEKTAISSLAGGHNITKKKKKNKKHKKNKKNGRGTKRRKYNDRTYKKNKSMRIL
jgi:hypothetical protein